VGALSYDGSAQESDGPTGFTGFLVFRGSGTLVRPKTENQAHMGYRPIKEIL